MSRPRLFTPGAPADPRGRESGLPRSPASAASHRGPDRPLPPQNHGLSCGKEQYSPAGDGEMQEGGGAALRHLGPDVPSRAAPRRAVPYRPAGAREPRCLSKPLHERGAAAARAQGTGHRAPGTGYRARSCREPGGASLSARAAGSMT